MFNFWGKGSSGICAPVHIPFFYAVFPNITSVILVVYPTKAVSYAIIVHISIEGGRKK
jgi:hypothetical protein